MPFNELPLAEVHPFEFPKHAYFGQKLQKNFLYSKLKISAKTKKALIAQVEKILWMYKLSPKTVNLKEGDTVKEIQMIALVLKEANLSEEVLQLLDKAIPSPIIFLLQFDTQQRFTAAYKPNEKILSPYFYSTWVSSENPQRSNLPIALDLQMLYQKLVQLLIGLKQRKDETLESQIERFNTCKNLLLKKYKLEKQMKATQQFNRKVELNMELNRVMEEYYSLL
jgi:hypothetical protein